VHQDRHLQTLLVEGVSDTELVPEVRQSVSGVPGPGKPPGDVQRIRHTGKLRTREILVPLVPGPDTVGHVGDPRLSTGEQVLPDGPAYEVVVTVSYHKCSHIICLFSL